MNILDLIRQDVEIPDRPQAHTHGGEWQTSCPFCGGKNRFHIQPERPGNTIFWCRQCGKKGDAIQYLREKYQLGYMDAKIEAISLGVYAPQSSDELESIQKYQAYLQRQGKPTKVLTNTQIVSSAPTAPILPFGKADLDQVMITNQAVQDYHECGAFEAGLYFLRYEILPETVRHFQVGHIVTQYYEGYTIPHFMTMPDSTRRVRGVKIRVMDQFVKSANDNKYLSLNTSRTGGVFHDRWTSNPDGSRLGPYLPYLFVVEDEKTCMLLNQQGWPCVAYKFEGQWDPFLRTVFSKVARIFYICDNDQPDSRGHYAGRENGVKFKSLIPDKTVLLMPEKYKQLSDMSLHESCEAVDRWIISKTNMIRWCKGEIA